MKKCAFILPYFGKFNNYFQLFLNSCGFNKEFEWLIFTDDKTEYEFPQNVKVKYTTFEWVVDLIRKKMNINPDIQDMHKICDFKPAYGLIFEEFLKEYRYWGHCDCDLLFGNLERFLPDAFLERYDKIFTQGHCVIYRNTDKVNRAFMLELNGKSIYKHILESPKTLAFDEEYLPQNVNAIFKENGFKVFEYDYSANIARKYGDFRIVHYDPLINNYLEESKKRRLYVWDNGNLQRYEKKFGELIRKDVMYIHLQSRKMRMDNDLDLKFKIMPNKFEKLETENINATNFDKIKYKCINTHRIKIFKEDMIFWNKKIISFIKKKLGLTKRR